MTIRKRVTIMVIRLMLITRGSKMLDYWLWEMTSYPAGLPFWRQIRVGLAIVLGMDFVARRYKERSDAEEAAIMKSYSTPLVP